MCSTVNEFTAYFSSQLVAYGHSPIFQTEPDTCENCEKSHVFKRHWQQPISYSINCAQSNSLLITLSVSHSPTLCQTTTPPSKTPTPRSAPWMERKPGWTVRLCHSYFPLFVRVIAGCVKGFVGEQRVCCTVMWYDTGSVFALRVFHSLVRTCTWPVLLHGARL